MPKQMSWGGTEKNLHCKIHLKNNFRFQQKIVCCTLTGKIHHKCVCYILLNMAVKAKFGEISFKKRFTYPLKSVSIDNGQTGLFRRLKI